MKVLMNLKNCPAKVNFVDENNVFLGYDLEQDCCEEAGWFIADHPSSAIQARPEPPEDLTGFVFDTRWHCRIQWEQEFVDKPVTVVCFRIHRQGEEKFVHLYNAHNGYYMHGFCFSAGKDCILESKI